MTHWYQLIQEKLNISWLAPTTATVPFGLTGVAGREWQYTSLDSVTESHWRLQAHTISGLEAEWNVAFFGDTRALECWGQVTHCGSDLIRGIRECLSIDVDWQLPEAFGQPWLRSVNGVRFAPVCFPPYDFAVVDRQLIHTPQIFLPLSLCGSEDGRTSGENLPCAILCDEGQTHGLACFLEWAGLWRIAFLQDARDFGVSKPCSALKMQVALSGLRVDLQPGASLPLPRVLLTVFDGDLEDGGNSLRRHIRRHITPKLDGQEVLPPTSFNHWFAFGANFTAETLKPAVEASAAAGLEYFCVDAAWYRPNPAQGVGDWGTLPMDLQRLKEHDGDFRSGIGNWSDGDPTKFSQGIKPFADFVRSHGLKFGTWFEPEWAHCESELYRQHPDWFWPSPADTMWHTVSAWYFFNPEVHLLNFGLPEVRQWWLERVVRAYEEWGMRWMRWDFNQMPRPNWDEGISFGAIGWRQIEHVLGLYKTLEAIMEACPDLFIEQCAAGGHRIELGTVRRGHAFWMNDHTGQSDIVRALQHGLNTVLPGNYANTNLYQNRHNFTDYDFLSYGSGSFGYSGKLWEAPRADFARFVAAVQRFKSYRRALLGDYHRPTGQPTHATDYVKVAFNDSTIGAIMEFNLDGELRSASIDVA